MNSIKRVSLIAMIIMTIVSFTNFFGANIAGISVLIGTVFFFVNKTLEKQSFRDSGFDMKAITTNFKNAEILYLVFLPLIMNAVCITIAKLFLPKYTGHVLGRTGSFLSFDKIILLIFQLVVLALGEEIAWRAFFQNQLSKTLSAIPALLISSILFTIGHFTEGSAIIVAYDIFFIFINGILYGVLFHKTNNAWVSAIAHFMANVFSVIILVFI